MRTEVKISWIEGRNTMDFGKQNTMGRKKNTMGRGVKVLCVEGSICEPTIHCISDPLPMIF
jgi:hypothetical protein